MALHAPLQRMGVTSHHALRNTLLLVGVAALVVVLLAAALVIKPFSTTSTTSDILMTPQLIEFRAGERAYQPAVDPGSVIPALLP